MPFTNTLEQDDSKNFGHCDAIVVSGVSREIAYYLRHEKVYSLQAAAFIALMAKIIHEKHVELSTADYSNAYIVARCAGACLRVAVPSVFMPLTYSLWKK